MLQFQELSNTVFGALFSVHNILGAGLVESAYEGPVVIKLQRLGLRFSRQKVYPLYYKGELAGAYIADLVVENSIIVELKSVNQLNSVMEAQLLNYLRLSKVPVGYLVNFRNTRLQWKRLVI
ncbi:MAG: GxxExxY protein [Spirochaetota bacterium]|nr:GxxExxY protein [Spirochaetota bacterium]